MRFRKSSTIDFRSLTTRHSRLPPIRIFVLVVIESRAVVWMAPDEAARGGDMDTIEEMVAKLRLIFSRR